MEEQSVANAAPQTVTIFGQLHPGTPKPPLELPGWAPPRPPGVAGYPAVSPPPLFGRLPQAQGAHISVATFPHLRMRVSDLKMKIGRIY